MKVTSYRAVLLGAAAAALLAGCGRRETAPAPSATPAANTRAGPSFDCAKASTPLEKETCRDPELAAVDSSMAVAYAAALAAFPDEFRPALRASQRSFLAYAEVKCRRADGFEPDCLASAYRGRAADLRDDSPHKDGHGREFLVLTTYKALPYAPPKNRAPGEDEYEQPTRLTVLPQIARPANAAERRWNAEIARRLDRFQAKGGFGPQDEGENRYSAWVHTTTPDFIDARLEWKGPPRWGYGEKIHWSLKLGREITPADLFTDPETAFAALAKAGAKHFEAGGMAAPDTPPPADADIREALADLQNWDFDEDGLDLSIGKDPPVFLAAHIPWSEIKPLLRKDAAVDPTGLKSAP